MFHFFVRLFFVLCVYSVGLSVCLFVLFVCFGLLVRLFDWLADVFLSGLSGSVH